MAGWIGGEHGDEAEGRLLAPRLQLAADVGLAEGAAFRTLGRTSTAQGP